MGDIRDYIKLSNAANSVVHSFSMPDDFKEIYRTVNHNEKSALIRHFIVNNIPFAFKDKPILYEQLAQYFADKLGITPTEIKLIGSAKTGFSISPFPNYGKNFGQNSDLDFSIINEEVFCKLENEFKAWANQFELEQIEPLNKTETKYWNQNLIDGPRQLRHKFIDTRFIPNRPLFIMTKKINNSLWIITKKLVDVHDIKVKKATASIYKNWESFAGRLNRNTDFVMNTVVEK